ncbi:MAG TPA: aminopeptidase N [Azospirillaceae bacterium]|nr:aminopeptidase N [Azospirillaceae bacterium]
MQKPAPRPIHRLDYTPPAYLIDTVELHFDLHEDKAVVRARSAVRANPDAKAGQPLVLNGQSMRLVSVALDGKALGPDEHRLTPDDLTIERVPARFTLEVVTELEPQKNTALEGLYKSSGNFCTQCEAEGFRKITYFLDRPDVMARYTTTVEADATRYPVLLSNGNPVARGEAAGGRHWVRWEDPHPKPCYLFALVAGNLAVVKDRFRTRSGRDVELAIYVEPGNEDKCDHAMRSLINSMKWDEDVYGLEYDLDVFNIVAVSDFNMGAMENKGLNIFNTKYILAKPETATDTDFLGVEAVVAHEYFHNWTGNRVTCRDWFQLSLKEGLTVFRDQQFSGDMNSPAVKRIQDVQRLRAGQFAEDGGPMAHPVRPDSYIEINNFYTMTVYEKGAEVVRMQHTLLGPDRFRKGTDLYFQRHDGQAVTCDDFVAAMEDAGGVDLGQFRRWYAQAGTPVVEAQTRWDGAAGTLSLTLRQSTPPTPGQPDKLPLHIPVAVGLVGPDGRDRPVTLMGENGPGATTRVLDLREAEQTFVFTGLDAEPVPSLFRGFSAPVKLKAPVSDAHLAFLLAHDSDPFNRWEAGQTLATRLLLRLVADHQAGRDLTVPEGVVDAFGRLLADAGQDRAFAALALTLPSEGYLGQQMDVIDVDAIHAARLHVRKTLAQRLRPQWMDIYRGLRTDGPFHVSPDAIGRRSLKNLALGYLMALEDREAVDLCVAQFRTATAMTDALAALQLLAASDAPERADALAAFAERWKDEPLVMDKWFAVQATSPRASAIGDVRALLSHPAFQLTNPNKVYALLGSFAGGNPVRFHDRSGEGYRLHAEQALKLDAMNPQVAARLFGAFTRWRQFDEGRQALMRAELERIVATPGLSPDSYEIISKSLNA